MSLAGPSSWPWRGLRQYGRATGARPVSQTHEKATSRIALSRGSSHTWNPCRFEAYAKPTPVSGSAKPNDPPMPGVVPPRSAWSTSSPPLLATRDRALPATTLEPRAREAHLVAAGPGVTSIFRSDRKGDRRVRVPRAGILPIRPSRDHRAHHCSHERLLCEPAAPAISIRRHRVEAPAVGNATQLMLA